MSSILFLLSQRTQFSLHIHIDLARYIKPQPRYVLGKRKSAVRPRDNLPRLPRDSLKHATNFKRLTGLSGMVCTLKNKDVNFKVEGILEKKKQ